MPLMNWKDDYSVKVRTIDQQHKKLIELLNQLYDAMRAQKGKEVLGQVLNELVTYTNTHFTFEEGLMQKHSYPAFESHKLQHQMLVKKVLEFQKEFSAGRATGTIDVMNFLKDWLNDHILGTDRQYASFFETKGVK
jgi:hemerythrin